MLHSIPAVVKMVSMVGRENEMGERAPERSVTNFFLLIYPAIDTNCKADSADQAAPPTSLRKEKHGLTAAMPPAVARTVYATAVVTVVTSVQGAGAVGEEVGAAVGAVGVAVGVVVGVAVGVVVGAAVGAAVGD